MHWIKIKMLSDSSLIAVVNLLSQEEFLTSWVKINNIGTNIVKFFIHSFLLKYLNLPLILKIFTDSRLPSAPACVGYDYCWYWENVCDGRHCLWQCQLSEEWPGWPHSVSTQPLTHAHHTSLSHYTITFTLSLYNAL